MAAGDRIFMAKESTSQEILSNTKKIIEDAKAKPKRYGMRINLLDSNPATRVKYLYDAVGMTPAGMNFAGGGFDYGDWCRMSPLEIISRLCDVTETLSAIVKKQQTIIEQSKIEEAVRVELRQEVEETDREMDVLEYHMRKYCDTDDLEATEFGKENAVDD